MTGGRRFTPDWGQDHLSLDAVVAYVDDELTAGPHARAEAHLAGCPECRAEVIAQRQARAVLRAAAGPRLPSSLLHNLRSIPVEAELPPPPPGLGITADGQFVLLRDVPDADMHSADIPPADVPPADDPRHPEGPPRRLSRRARFGAVSGLAVGALAVGALAVPGAWAPSSGVFGGAVLEVPAAPPTVHPAAPADGAASPAVLDRTGAPPIDATPAVIATSSARTDATAATDPTDADSVLGPLRARLERVPAAFSRSR